MGFRTCLLAFWEGIQNLRVTKLLSTCQFVNNSDCLRITKTYSMNYICILSTRGSCTFWNIYLLFYQVQSHLFGLERKITKEQYRVLCWHCLLLTLAGVSRGSLLSETLVPCCHNVANIKSCKRSTGFHNHGKGPYYGLLLVESTYERIHLSHLRHH